MKYAMDGEQRLEVDLINCECSKVDYKGKMALARALEPCEPGRRLHCGVMSDLFQILPPFDTLEDLHPAASDTTNNEPLGVGAAKRHPPNVIQTGGNLGDEIQRVARDREDRDRVAFRGGVIAVRGVQVGVRKLLVRSWDEDFCREHVVWIW